MKWAEARRRHLEQNGLPVPVKTAPTLSEFGPRWLLEYAVANGCKPATMDIYKRNLSLHLYPVLGTSRLNKIGAAEVQKVKLHLAGMSDKTIANILSLLGVILHTAVRWGEIDKAPTIEQPRLPPSERRFFEFDDWEKLVAGARKIGPQALCMVLLGGEAGLRRGEMVALEQADVGKDVIEVRRNEWRGHIGTPKGGKTRRIPMTSRLKEAVAAIRHLRGARLLWQDNGEPVGIDTLRSWMFRAMRAAGLPASMNIHSLRHTFCSHLAMRGAPVTVIQRLAGHANLGTTCDYMHLAKGALEDGIAALERGTGVEQRAQIPTPSEEKAAEDALLEHAPVK
jgi:integrase